MDILAQLPDTHAGRHTRWLWSWMLAVSDDFPRPAPEELAEHFAPLVFEQVPAEQLCAHFAGLARTMSLVTCWVEEANSEQCYSVLLFTADRWLRYTCYTEDDHPHLLIGAGYSQALDPRSYTDRRVQREGRDVQIRDFGGSGPLVLLWHGAGGDLTNWETLVPHLAGFHLIAQDLPGHGRSRSNRFTISDALADADAVIAELQQGPPALIGHSLGGYLGLRYAATRTCSGWIGLDGPLGLVYPWDQEEPGLPENVLQIAREIAAIDVVKDFAAVNCPVLLLLGTISASPIEECLAPARRELAAHVARHHPDVRVEWVQTSHDAMMFQQTEETGARIRSFLCSQSADDPQDHPAGVLDLINRDDPGEQPSGFPTVEADR